VIVTGTIVAVVSVMTAVAAKEETDDGTIVIGGMTAGTTAGMIATGAEGVMTVTGADVMSAIAAAGTMMMAVAGMQMMVSKHVETLT
jgi:hypothetical protein